MQSPEVAFLLEPSFLILPGTITAFLFTILFLNSSRGIGRRDARGESCCPSILYPARGDDRKRRATINVCRWLPRRCFSLPLPCPQITVPPITAASSRWSWDPEEERKRQEKWQKEQQRVLQVTNHASCSEINFSSHSVLMCS